MILITINDVETVICFGISNRLTHSFEWTEWLHCMIFWVCKVLDFCESVRFTAKTGFHFCFVFLSGLSTDVTCVIIQIMN